MSIHTNYPKQTVEVLQEVILLLGPEGQNWIKGEDAKDKHGIEVHPIAPKASSFSLTGAIEKASYGKSVPYYIVELNLWKVLNKYYDIFGFICDSSGSYAFTDNVKDLLDYNNFPKVTFNEINLLIQITIKEIDNETT